ncbi:MAG: hypothetical protein RBR84_02415 [Bacteroidales bacterium]|nr:hypothetical protein [Bacteroidales bacterium]MDY0084749.1 hypothetical protein [Bacteroidales bacterium]HOI31763.1 hypothetical protein [Bacteroidales bacterium]
MEGFLLFIFWVILIFYLFRLFFRYGLPWLLSRYVRKMQEKMQGTHQAKQKPKEGEVKVKMPGNDQPRVDPDIGEYVDFEEVKDNNKPENEK